VELDQFVADFARGMQAADALRPQAAHHRDATRLYKLGIGPFGEDAAVAMTVAQMRLARADAYEDLRKLAYPAMAKTCDLALGQAPDWAVEVKVARVRRDNGTYEDTAVKRILSPYEDDRSAVTDCLKLASSGFAGRKAVLIYGFEDPDRPLRRLIDAFELVACQYVRLGPRSASEMVELVHPHHA
jgi:hypothetical protein